jgi:hypothetical protein
MDGPCAGSEAVSVACASSVMDIVDACGAVASQASPLFGFAVAGVCLGAELYAFHGSLLRALAGLPIVLACAAGAAYGFLIVSVSGYIWITKPRFGSIIFSHDGVKVTHRAGRALIAPWPSIARVYLLDATVVVVYRRRLPSFGVIDVLSHARRRRLRRIAERNIHAPERRG